MNNRAIQNKGNASNGDSADSDDYYTCACDLICSFAGYDAQGAKISSDDASRIIFGVAEVIGMDAEEFTRRLADYYHTHEDDIVEKSMREFATYTGEENVTGEIYTKVQAYTQGDGRIIARVETNDDNDDGNPGGDADVAKWTTDHKDKEAFLKVYGKSRTGFAGHMVTILLDGIKM